MNRLKNQSKLAVLALIAIIASSIAVQAYPTADSFQNPLSSYAVTGYRFGENEMNGNWHYGEDIMASPLTPVYAVANGQLKQSQIGAKGYGQVVVIEHKLPQDGTTKIVSIYGHLSKTKYMAMPIGKDITKGELIGYIGYTSENGGSSPHLHFGIRKGAYVGLYEGFGSSTTGLSNFYKPSDFLNLVKAVNTPEVYRLVNLGNKIWVPSADTFNSCGWSWNDIRPVSIAERNNHATTSGVPCFAAGTFIKRANNPEISLIRNYQDTSFIQNRFRHPIDSWNAYLRYGGKSDLSNVRIVSQDEYYTHTQGKTLY